jgi:hypothetical protein
VAPSAVRAINLPSECVLGIENAFLPIRVCSSLITDFHVFSPTEKIGGGSVKSKVTVFHSEIASKMVNL